ncbi:MAG: hypothetical protein MJ102_06735 [Clostridia bacterium]|nr:hypothetical protein [Clostridia bacterium]
MTIQPSIIIWTIINFVLFMLVVDRLLFRPVLAVMDKRQAKIDAARAAKAPDTTVAPDTDKTKNLIPQQTAEEIAEIEEAKAALISLVSDAETRGRARIESCRQDLDLQRAELNHDLEDGADKLAAAFASRLVS